MASLPKHIKYMNSYKPNDFFWGIGIENETYIELGYTEKMASFIKTNQKRDRYCVDYWAIYKENAVQNTLTNWISKLPERDNTRLKIPVLLNAHSLLSTDPFGNHKTTYEKHPKPNPAFKGKTIYEHLCEKNSVVFGDKKEITWTFDGDTIEFMTQNFYKAKIEDVVDELIKIKKEWIESLRIGIKSIEKEKTFECDFRFPTKNHGFAIYLTNRSNIAIFNNGTYHFNITLPTQLDGSSKIKQNDVFRAQHQAAARMFQWISPFLVAKFGSPDILALLTDAPLFPKGSQRICASRYVSVGTYDTEVMEPGKLLQINNRHGAHRWYDTIYDDLAIGYTRLEKIGLDINFNKHLNHGLEFRIFDEFPETQIMDVLRLFIWMCDEALLKKDIEDPRKNAVWNNLVARAVLEGKNTVLNEEEKKVFSYTLNLTIHSNKITDIYQTLWETWCDRWNWSKNSCSELMIRAPLDRSKTANTQNGTVFMSSKVSVEVQTDTVGEIRPSVPSTPHAQSVPAVTCANCCPGFHTIRSSHATPTLTIIH
jgi:hypothetical protein